MTAVKGLGELEAAAALRVFAPLLKLAVGDRLRWGKLDEPQQESEQAALLLQAPRVSCYG